MKALIDIEIEDERWLEAVKDAHVIVTQAIEAAITATKLDINADVVVLLTDDLEMRRLNAEFRQKDRATNVLSFPAPKSLSVKGQLDHLGDIALGFETCLAEAEQQEKTLSSHLSHLAIHGTLHLLGYDHEDEKDAREMESLETQILKTLGIDNPYEERVTTQSTKN